MDTLARVHQRQSCIELGLTDRTTIQSQPLRLFACLVTGGNSWQQDGSVGDSGSAKGMSVEEGSLDPAWDLIV